MTEKVDLNKIAKELESFNGLSMQNNPDDIVGNMFNNAQNEEVIKAPEPIKPPSAEEKNTPMDEENQQGSPQDNNKTEPENKDSENKDSESKDSTEAEDKPKRKRMSGFKKAEEAPQDIEIPDSVKAKLAMLDDMLSNPVIKLAYESQNKGEDFMSKVVEINNLNPVNMSLKQKYQEQLRREGASQEEIEDAVEDFELLKGYEQRERVREIDKALNKEYKEKIKNIKIDVKEYVDPEKMKQQFISESEKVINTIKGQDFYGVTMNDSEIKSFKDVAMKPLWNLTESGAPVLDEYLEAAWKVHNFERVLQSAIDIAHKKGFNEGIIYKRDSDSHSGAELKKNISNRTSPTQKSNENSLDYHMNNAPDLKHLFGG